MTDLRREAEASAKKWWSGSRCHCDEIDFTDWPTDLRAACEHCRRVDEVEAAFKAQRREEVEAIQAFRSKWGEAASIDHWLSQRKKALE